MACGLMRWISTSHSFSVRLLTLSTCAARRLSLQCMLIFCLGEAQAEIVISDNPLLRDLDGLSAITEASGVTISDNSQLSNIDGLLNIERITGNLYVIRNQNLRLCEALVSVLGWPNGPPGDQVDGDIGVYSNSYGCNSTNEILNSVSGPTQPVINSHSTERNSLVLAFTQSTTTDRIFPVTGYQASCETLLADVSKSDRTDLLDNTPINQTLRMTNEASDPSRSDATLQIEIDITHTDPTDLYVTLTSPDGRQVVLWNQGNPGGQDLQGTFPTTLTPVESLDTLADGDLYGDWTLSVEDRDVGPIVREGVLSSWGLRITETTAATGGASSPISLAGMGRGRDHTCTVAPLTAMGIGPVSSPYVASMALQAPLAPEIISTDYEDGLIHLAFSPSSDNGGTDITEYEATCTDGTNTFTGTSTSSPITVSGLTNGVAYTCTVTATNSVGTSSASAATTPITPEATATGLPIWLLYQATQ